MKGDVIADWKIQNALKDFIFAELWTDRGTREDDENNALRIDQFGGALPLYLVLDAEGNVLSRLDGISSASGFAEFLKTGLDAYRRQVVQ